MTDIAALGFAVDSAPLTKGAAELDRLTASAKKAEDAAIGMGSRVTDAAKKAEAANGGASASTQNLANSYGMLEVMARRAAAAVSLIAGALSVQAIAGLADVYSDLNARVGLAIRNMEASREVMDRLNVVARRTYSSLELTAESFVRNANTLRELGKSTNEQLDFTEALNLALVVSGAKAERARMLQDSLAKAMAGGALRGQELNTVIESGGRVAEVLAEELGVSTNQLRRMGEQGKITSDVIFNALTKRLQQLQEEAEKMPATIGDAFLIVRNAALQLIGVYDQQNKLSESLATTIISLADNLDILAKSAVSLGIALTVAFSGTIIGAVRSLTLAIATGLVTAFNALTAAMLRNPFTAIATAITIVIANAYLFRDELSKATGVMGFFGRMVDLAEEKLLSLSDTFGAFVDAVKMKATSAVSKIDLSTFIKSYEKTLAEAEEGRKNALRSGSQTAVDTFDREIALLEDMLARAREEYAGLEKAEQNFTDLVVELAAKRREAREKENWEKATSVNTMDVPNPKAEDLPDTKAFDKRTEAVRRQVEAMRIEAETYGMTEAAAARYRIVKELENEATKAGIELSTMRRAEILAEADAFSQATARIEGLRLVEQMQTTEEAEQEHYERRLEMLREFQASGTATVEQTAMLWQKIQEDHLLATASAYGQTADRIAGTLDALSGAIGQEGKKQFEISKALSIASAVLKGYESAVSSYAAGAKIGGPPLGAAYAALSIASTAAMIAQIKGTSYNSGSSSSSRSAASGGGSGSGGGTTAQQPTQAQGGGFAQNMTIQMVGTRYTREEVRGLIEEINKTQRDGSKINVEFA